METLKRRLFIPEGPRTSLNEGPFDFKAMRARSWSEARTGINHSREMARDEIHNVSRPRRLASRNSSLKNSCPMRDTDESQSMDAAVNNPRVSKRSLVIDQVRERARRDGQKEKEKGRERERGREERKVSSFPSPFAASSNADISSGRSANIAASFT